MSQLMINKKTMLRWDQSVNLVNLHLQGVYDHAYGHTRDINTSSKISNLENLAKGMNGELINIFHYEDINSLVDQLISNFNKPKISIVFQNVSSLKIRFFS